MSPIFHRYITYIANLAIERGHRLAMKLPSRSDRHAIDVSVMEIAAGRADPVFFVQKQTVVAVHPNH